MKTIHLWKGSNKLKFFESYSTSLPQDAIKIGFLKDSLVLLDTQKSVWFGTISADFTVEFNVSHFNIVDFICSNDIVYLLNDRGKVYKAFYDDFVNLVEVVLFEEAKCCPHGHTTNSQHIFVKSLSAGSMGVLFLSDTGHLWVSGDHPQLDIHKDNEPTKVGFFEGRHILAVNSGKDFNIALTHKRESGICPVLNEDRQSLEENVFSSACPQCLSENIISPLSPQNDFDTCPLGVPLTNNTPSPSTPTSRNNTIASEDRNHENDNTSSTSEDNSCSILRDDKSISELREEEDSLSVIVEKGDGMGLLHINTESARQFLTRQLSWVSSGGEELLAEVSGPTKIIKQNVSTMASYVYEGVKTVGDKVATLSRHMSGGSDNNDSDSFDDFVTDDFNLSRASNNSSVKCEWSCSGACSDVSDRGTAERLAAILARGARLVKTELWTWGSVQHGQLGTGDMVKRHRPVLVNQLVHSAVVRVICGDSHCLALTLTGLCYAWGANECGQATGNRGGDVSSPVAWGRVLRAAAGARHSVLIAPDHTLHWLGKHRSEDMSSTLAGEVPLEVLCAGDFTCVVASNSVGGGSGVDVASASDLASEQCFLDELLDVYNSVLKPLARKSNLDDLFCLLSCKYVDVLQLTAVNVASMTQGTSICKILQDHIDEYLQIYDAYLSAVCGVVAMSGFSQLARFIDIPARLTAIFSDRLPSRKTTPEAILTCAFTHPLTRVSVYKMMLCRGQPSVPAAAVRWEELWEKQESARKLADTTRLFWESCGRLVDTLRTPARRLVRESRSHPLSVANASRFSSQWLILLTDALVHVSSGHIVHSLDTLWCDTIPDNDTLQNALTITTPEETLTLVTPNQSDKTEWMYAIQNTIKTKLNKAQASSARLATYTFTRHTSYKDATYTGRWVGGKMEGQGRLQWADGRVYCGQFHANLPHGLGRLDTPGASVYEGQWKDGLQNGLGTTRYENGDMYEGYYKDGLASGHGVRKSGSLQAGSGTLYVGEWVAGQRHGYGVMDDICTGEKYLGSWSNNLKNGTGLIVTLEGIYYEGPFTQDVLTGHGVMVFEDGAHYEGELKAAGQFSGKGTLTFATGDRLEGSLHGSWADGVKVAGTLHKRAAPPTTQPAAKTQPSSLGKLCPAACQRWRAVFRQCWLTLGAGPDGKAADTERAWDSVAVALAGPHRHHEVLTTIPVFGRSTLDTKAYHNVSTYLHQAFDSVHHPLGAALRDLTRAYNATYGGRVHPLLLTHAVEELHSVAERLYQIVRVLFPALPSPGRETPLADNDSVLVSLSSLLHPILLPRFHSALFELYALNNKSQDACYWKRLLKWNKNPNGTLMAFLGISRKFWFGAEDTDQAKSDHRFNSAVETLQQLKTTFCPMEKLKVIQSTFEQMTKVVRSELGADYIWTMDELFPVFVFVVVRACVSQLGSEIHFVEDFMEPRLANGEFGIMITTLKAGYVLILQEKISIDS